MREGRRVLCEEGDVEDGGVLSEWMGYSKKEGVLRRLSLFLFYFIFSSSFFFLLSSFFLPFFVIVTSFLLFSLFNCLVILRVLVQCC